jgi:hypothetical protein
MLKRATSNPKTYIALDAADERIVAERSSAVKNVCWGWWLKTVIFQLLFDIREFVIWLPLVASSNNSGAVLLGAQASRLPVTSGA